MQNNEKKGLKGRGSDSCNKTKDDLCDSCNKTKDNCLVA